MQGNVKMQKAPHEIQCLVSPLALQHDEPLGGPQSVARYEMLVLKKCKHSSSYFHNNSAQLKT